MLTEMKGIVKDFGPVRAVDHIDFTVHSGEIIGLLGENGAGKTTLMNVLAGTFPPGEGEIYIDGNKVQITSSLHAMKLGIRFIHQEISLCNDLRVFENMFLAEEIIGKNGLLNKKEMARRCSQVFERMQVNIDPYAIVWTLQPSERQLVEIARALLFKCDLIIMDEPSTALGTKEIKKLFDIMRQLKSEGVSFIYISHKMPELFEICDFYYIMRDGKLVAQGKFSDIDEQQATELMIGRHLADDEFSNKPYYGNDEIALSVNELNGRGFHDISFDLHKGEILAVTGLQGSGRDTLADALFGAEEYTGTLQVKGETLKQGSGIIDHMRNGIGMVPRSRKERGIHNDLSIYDNISMAFFNTKFKSLLINNKTEKERFLREKLSLSIKTDQPKNPITSLSGGNQQKVILGRWLEADADILLFDNPTQGIDVGTKFEIYRLIIELAKNGKSIIVFSSEYPEIHKVADACIVLYKGRINARLKREEITEMSIMYYSTGANLEAIKND
ncbi:MAG: sugar ABC transporter ATP-binding protein [Flexilinea sp.]